MTFSGTHAYSESFGERGAHRPAHCVPHNLSGPSASRLTRSTHAPCRPCRFGTRPRRHVDRISKVPADVFRRQRIALQPSAGGGYHHGAARWEFNVASRCRPSAINGSESGCFRYFSRQAAITDLRARSGEVRQCRIDNRSCKLVRLGEVIEDATFVLIHYADSVTVVDPATEWKPLVRTRPFASTYRCTGHPSRCI